MIRPALDAGNIVILDRYIDSSFAYQAYARGLGFDFVSRINTYALENCMPDVTVFMDVRPEQAFKRKGGADDGDRIELEGLEFHNKVYAGYKELEKKFPNRIVSFAAQGTKYETSALIIEYLKGRGFIK